MKYLYLASIAAVILYGKAVTAEESAVNREILREVHSLQETIKSLTERMNRQAKQIEKLEREKARPQPAAIAPPLPTQSGPAPSTAAPSPETVRVQSTFFNPEIGGVLDLTASATESHEDEEGNDRLSVRQVELALGQDIDPYTRFDSTFGIADFEEFSIEEAYVTYFGLPAKLRLGRIRPPVGKATVIHRDSLDTVDEPFVVERYLGVEGLSRTAAEASGFLPFPWEAVAHELTVGTMEGGVGEEGELFGESRRIPSFYTHLKNFWEISDVANWELGGTYLTGSHDEDGAYEVHAFGADSTLNYYVTSSNKLKLLGEVYFQDRREPSTENEEGDLIELDRHPAGFYALVDYRLSPRFGAGARYDYVEPILSAEGEDRGYALYLTFFQSEFARWRAQYEYADLATGENDNRFFLQGTFAFGVHRHQLN